MEQKLRMLPIIGRFVVIGPLVGTAAAVAGAIAFNLAFGLQPVRAALDLFAPGTILLMIGFGFLFGLLPALLSGVAIGWLAQRRGAVPPIAVGALIAGTIGALIAAAIFRGYIAAGGLGGISAFAGAVCTYRVRGLSR